MILADVNVLIYAFRRDSERHAVCKYWLDNIVRSDAQFGLSPLALSGLARIVTNPRIFVQPSPIEEVFAFCDGLFEPASLRDRASWAAALANISAKCASKPERAASLVADAWFAALAIEHGCAWISYDRDYARFPGLDWREPDI